MKPVLCLSVCSCVKMFVPVTICSWNFQKHPKDAGTQSVSEIELTHLCVLKLVAIIIIIII